MKYMKIGTTLVQLLWHMVNSKSYREAWESIQPRKTSWTFVTLLEEMNRSFTNKWRVMHMIY